MVHQGESRRPRHRFPRVEETSAGGLVVADYGVGEPSAVLIGRIDRRGSGRLLWSIPKGHIEAGETPEEAAVREIAEETGIVGEILAPLGSIAFWFVEDGRRIHKTVHHFLLRPVGGALSTADHEVAEVAWVPLPEAVDRLCHADERELAVRAGGLLAERRTCTGRPHTVTRLPAADHAPIPGEGTHRAARRAPEPPGRG